MKILKFLGAIIATALLLAACGGASNTLTGATGSSGGGTTTGPPATATSIIVSASPASILADGSTTSTITATALDANSAALPNVPITLAAVGGVLGAASGTRTGTSGTITATLSTGGNPTLRTITVTATSGTLSATVPGGVQVVASASASPASHLKVTSDTPTILSDGSTSANITVFVSDSSFDALPNVPVTLSASSGLLQVASSPPTTDASGTLKAVLITGGDPTLRTITVTAQVNALTATTTVQVIATPPPVTVQLGSGTGTAFVPNTIAVSNPVLSAGGSTSLSVVLEQSNGTLYTQSATINFSSPCAAQSFATLTPSVTTTTGVANGNYSASGCAGTDVITATTTINGAALSASATVTVAQAAIGSIEFLSATPTIIALKGIGSTSLPESSTVIFKVLDQSGNPRPGAIVNFSLDTSVGGIALLNASATADATGSVQTVVQSGTVATPVRVTAIVQGVSPAISTQSSQLIVSTGIPTQGSFSLSVKCPNVEAWAVDGVQVPVTARLADRFLNPVPDGTAVSFHTEGGSIDGSCTTTTTNGNSSCTVNWTSQNPRPVKDPNLPACTLPAIAGTCDRPGRSSLLAVAIGEESFTDLNGNGEYDPGEPWVDIPYRFVDNNESGSYVAGDYFYDFLNLGAYEYPNPTPGSADANNPLDVPACTAKYCGDGKFNGVLCNDPNHTGVCGYPSVGIGAQNLIIMSASYPANLAPAAGTTLPNIAPEGATVVFSFLLADLNNNPMPQGTTVEASITGNNLTLGAPSSFTVPCTTEPTSIGVIVTNSPASMTTGLLTLTITSPGGVVTIANYHINVP